MKSNWNIKKFSYDIFIDIVGGVLIGLGIYNFAANAEFPLAGVSGLALILYRLFNIPIGWGNNCTKYTDCNYMFQDIRKRVFFCTFNTFTYYFIFNHRLCRYIVAGIFR